MKRKRKKGIWRICIVLSSIILFFYWMQKDVVHRDKRFQNVEADVECESILGWITKSDRISGKESETITGIRPGDVILSMSTHTLGWRHGHAGLVIDEDTILECSVIGKKSGVCSTKQWQKYSNYVVLRMKKATEEKCEEVASYAMQHLKGVPYRLTIGMLGMKAPEVTKEDFGVHCAYLVWYAWYVNGYDLDADGGKIVSVMDLLKSEELEVIQAFGICVENVR